MFRATLKPTPTVNTSEQLAEEEEASPPLQLAVKEVLIGSKSNDDLAKIEKEIEMLKRVCHHPNTVQYFGCLPVDDSIWVNQTYIASPIPLIISILFLFSRFSQIIVLLGRLLIALL